MHIETERLIIRKFNELDIELIFEINNHPECIRFNGWESMSIEECKNVLDRWMNGYDKYENYGVFCVETIENQRIGMAFIMKYETSNDYEIGFRLRRDAWGNGYATEITKLFIDYAKKNLTVDCLCAEVDAKNVRSMNLFRKLGFIELIHPSGESGKLFKYDIGTV